MITPPTLHAAACNWNGSTTGGATGASTLWSTTDTEWLLLDVANVVENHDANADGEVILLEFAAVLVPAFLMADFPQKPAR